MQSGQLLVDCDIYLFAYSYFHWCIVFVHIYEVQRYFGLCIDCILREQHYPKFLLFLCGWYNRLLPLPPNTLGTIFFYSLHCVLVNHKGKYAQNRLFFKNKVIQALGFKCDIHGHL